MTVAFDWSFTCRNISPTLLSFSTFATEKIYFYYRIIMKLISSEVNAFVLINVKSSTKFASMISMDLDGHKSKDFLEASSLVLTESVILSGHTLFVKR